jgi:2-polyprenyl-6-methoxyphenol hydroxylase-like FAD-dependent oxidoreductase
VRTRPPGELGSWDHVKLLTVAVDRLKRWWRPGLLCIGDAAHAMSPVGGVGINLAVQDAVAAANRLADPLRRRAVTDADLEAVERRRALPVRLTQRLQIFVQNRVIGPTLARQDKVSAPAVVKLINRWPALRRIPGRLVGLGVLPEHVRTPDVGTAT